jgi:hypothetical protein
VPPPSPTDRATLVTRLRAAGCVYAEDEAELLLAAADSPATLADMTDRRVAGEPLEYLLGWAEFAGLRIAVDAGVFVPRARTALLVQVAAEVTGPAPAVVDLCCPGPPPSRWHTGSRHAGWPPPTSTRRRWRVRGATWTG